MDQKKKKDKKKRTGSVVARSHRRAANAGAIDRPLEKKDTKIKAERRS